MVQIIRRHRQGRLHHVRGGIREKLETLHRRVLGLAHSRTEGLAGHTTSFLSTLPIYVDPITPPTLRVGLSGAGGWSPTHPHPPAP